ncbi:MAG: M48 family metallopeptidase [Gammaproteobacteria bacterium]|nr:M48 family metallopeptidase [Gammaproteobacteria bacterium]
MALPSFAATDQPLILQPIELPDIGDPAGALLTPTDEHNLGQSLYQSLFESGDLLDDNLVNGYIQGLGERLLSSADSLGQKYTFFVVNESTINAFAAPGGFIGIFTGLIEFADTEDELAAVVAHEIAHVTQRHMARTFEAAEQFSVPLAVAILSAVLLARGSNSQVTDAALFGGLAGSVQQRINFTRANEEEADRVGIQILGTSGFDPHHMGGFFSRLQRESRYYGEQAPEFLRTHPVNSSRVADALGRADAWGKPRNPDPQVFELMRMRVKVLSTKDPRRLLVELTENKDQTPRRQIANRYGEALLRNQLGEYNAAVTLLTALLRDDALRVPYYVAYAEAELNLNQPQAALKKLTEGLNLYPGDHAMTLAKARAQLAAGDAENAYQLMQLHNREGNLDRETWTLLATAADRSGHRAAAHEAQAEKYLLEGDRETAIQQLKQAQRAASDDYYASSRIASRLRDLETQQQDSKKDKKSPP